MTLSPRISIALLSFAASALPLACGGGGGSAGSADPSTAKGSSHPKPRDPKESIGDLAAAQGGLAGLGGAGNREEGGTGVEVAMDAPLHASEVERGSPVKLDGVLKEWPARTPANENLSGKTDGLSLGVSVQYDDGKLYVAGEVGDPRLTRTSKHGDGDDHVTLTLGFPGARGVIKAYEVGFFAGKPGESVGAVKWKEGPSKGEVVPGAKIVESDVKGGYVFEAAIPWATFPEARTMRVGLRAAFRYEDGDGTKTVASIGNGRGDTGHASELPPLPTAPEQAVTSGLLAQKNLATTAPRIDVFADVAGDERKERISVFGKFFTICGPGYRGGHQFFWRETAGELASVETRDVTGRGKDDMIVRRRVTAPSGAVHEVLEVWSVAKGDEPQAVFSHEISVTEPGGKRKVANAVRVAAKEIEVTVEPGGGWDAASFKEPSAGEEAVLVPWGTVKSRTFKVEGGKFTRVSEVAQAGTAAPAAAAGATGGSGSTSTRDLPTPPVGKGADLGKQVMEAYLRDQGVPAGTRPRFDLEVHVDGDARPERVALVGRDVVVLGAGFKGGNGYARMSLTQFADDKDVGEVTARDVTGDGAAEIIVRGKRRVTSAAGDAVEIDAMFVYQVRAGVIARVFAVETGREQGGKRVQGLVQFVPAKGGKGFDVDVKPGVARGWTESTYPWPQEKTGGAIEPLLLPWGGTPGVRYAWNGSAFAAP